MPILCGMETNKTPRQFVGDRLKQIISEDIQIRTGSELPPMIGAFTFVAEFTDEKGKRQFICITDLSLPPWQEIGLLETRLTAIKDSWPGTPNTYGPEE